MTFHLLLWLACIGQQGGATGPITQVSWETADQFFKANSNKPVRPIVRRAFATYVEARSAYLAKNYSHCQAVLDDLWKELPEGTEIWRQADDRPTLYNLGSPDCYPALVMLDEACRWRTSPESASVKPFPIVMTVLLFGHSEGIQPRNNEDFIANKGRQTIRDLDTSLLKGDFAKVRSVTWLFQEYFLAMTKGKANVQLNFVYLPEETVHIETTATKRGDTWVGIAVPEKTRLTRQMAGIAKTLRQPTDWWWTIYPSFVPDEYPDFKTTEFISGGNSLGPDNRSLRLEADDRWLLRRPRHLGQGLYDPLEVEAYMPQWLAHEFHHHVFGRFANFDLEGTGHRYIFRDKWPTDFQGLFEPDYYREALHKRLLTATPPLNIRLRYVPPTAEQLNNIAFKNIAGVYRMDNAVNGWHEAIIEPEGQDENGRQILTWKNRAGAKWTLYVDGQTLVTGDDYPYRTEAKSSWHRLEMTLKRDDTGRYTNQFEGFSFQDCLWRKVN